MMIHFHPTFDSLIIDSDYPNGVKPQGGGYYNDNIFELNPDGTAFTTIHSFSGSDRANPYHGELIAVNNILYDMRTSGGANNHGLVFKFDLAAAIPVHLISSTAVSTINDNGRIWTARAKTNNKGFE